MCLVGAGCRGGEGPTCDTEALLASPPEDGVSGENVLVLVLDDVGVDKVGAYGVHDDPAPTPRLDELIAEGVRFDRGYASPSCSPTRASILTGRHPSRHGIGSWIQPRIDTYTLPESEVTFAEIAGDAGWSTGAVGKWHLSVYDGHPAELDPLNQGFDTFRGLLGNPLDALVHDGEQNGYWHWQKDTDGLLAYTDDYLTTVQVDDTLDLVTTLPEPWVVYVGFSAGHTPLDRPPSHLAIAASDEPPDLYDAVLEALDAELGRLLDGMEPDLRARTTIITLGDNGTADDAVRPPWDPTHNKATLWEAGVRVPFTVSGPRVATPGTVSEALVHAVDVFATVADLVGVDIRTLPAAIDGVSLLPLLDDPSAGPRRCVLVEQFKPDGDHTHRDTLGRAVIEDGYKLIRQRHDNDDLYRVGVDPSQQVEADDDDARDRLRYEVNRYERALR